MAIFVASEECSGAHDSISSAPIFLVGDVLTFLAPDPRFECPNVIRISAT